jgi:hypothetical protein
LKDVHCKSAITLALENRQPIVYALLDPCGARRKGDKLRQEFADARLVHVISTRYRRDKSQPSDSCDPRISAATVKALLEAEELVVNYGQIDEQLSTWLGWIKVFDPNADNAFLTRGDAASANAIWLRNWREVGLENARRTGGSCIQVIVPPGPSEMQVAEASMAVSEGVPVVKIDCSDVELAMLPRAARAKPEMQALRAQRDRCAAGDRLRVPPTRSELEARVAELQTVQLQNGLSARI